MITKERRKHVVTIENGGKHMKRFRELKRQHVANRIQRENREFHERMTKARPYICNAEFEASFAIHKKWRNAMYVNNIIIPSVLFSAHPPLYLLTLHRLGDLITLLVTCLTYLKNTASAPTCHLLYAPQHLLIKYLEASALWSLLTPNTSCNMDRWRVPNQLVQNQSQVCPMRVYFRR